MPLISADFFSNLLSAERSMRSLKCFCFMKRIVPLLITLFGTAGAVLAQFKEVPNPPVDPFDIKRGKSFSASGGSANLPPDPAAAMSRIAADIREASEIIKRNQIDGRAIKTEQLTRSAIDGMLDALDPHSGFYDAAEWKDLLDEQNSGYTGMGATIANYSHGGEMDTYILATFSSSPAAKARLRFGDKIVAINGKKMSGQTSEVVRDKIRGANGSSFRLTVERAATGRTEILEIRRNRVPQPSIPDAYILRPGVGYIDLTESFNYTTAEEFDTAMRELKRGGMKSLVLDLRGNGGGIVDQAVKIAERFLPAGSLILTQRGRSRIDNRVWKSTTANSETMPVVVLVDAESASASEIVAGAFQDTDRAMIVGEKTFGKGLVQSVISLPGGTGLTLTTARYLTPAGRSIQRDYSTGDRYDYFNHTAVAAAIGKPYFEARTITDRKVFGGDGIQPDEPVKREQTSAFQEGLLDPIFFFTRELLKERAAANVTFGTRIHANGLAVDSETLQRFVTFAIKSLRISPQRLEREAAFIKLRIRYNLAVASYGAVSAKQILIEEDAIVAKAIETLPRAAELTNLAAKKGRKPVREQ